MELILYIVLINLSLPCDDRSLESHIKYQNTLGELQCLLDDIQTNNLILSGDFNASYITESRFWPDLKIFTERNSLKFDDASLPSDSFTYLNPAHNTTSFIDHVISSQNMHVNNIEILYDCALFNLIIFQ